ncbi:MAG: hypothetical protein O2795_00575 [Acidobacteria bacterium]|nr:hypothetical protein [Acidobacteriota bacterium]
MIREPQAPEAFSSGVSLHSHTMYSRESTSFVAGFAEKSRLFNWLIRAQLRKYSEKYGERQLTDLNEQTKRMWWTSPISPAEALRVEKKQITERLSLRPLVSITDHDSIEAPLQLQMIADNDEAPVSLEWTAPYLDTYFHIGVHNLDPEWAQTATADMLSHTADPKPGRLRELLEELAAYPDVLLVLNHPYWDQPWNGQEQHDRLLLQFLDDFEGLIHALEINGLRTWTENRRVVELARSSGMKLISGGDRHGREPNATLNLTNAATFAEFVDEIRGGAESHVLVMPHFHDPLVMRIIQSLVEIMKDHPEHVHGRVHWSDRVFRRCEGADVKTFSEFFGGKEPAMTRHLLNGARWLSGPSMRKAWKRIAVPEEAAL